MFYPIAALHRAGLWELDADPETVPPAHGSTLPQRWFEERQPVGGLVEPVHSLIRDSPEARSAAVGALVEMYVAAADATELLDVDHVHELALGGPDNPLQMVALCPNCHRIKTPRAYARGAPRDPARRRPCRS